MIFKTLWQVLFNHRMLYHKKQLNASFKFYGTISTFTVLDLQLHFNTAMPSTINRIAW